MKHTFILWTALLLGITFSASAATHPAVLKGTLALAGNEPFTFLLFTEDKGQQFRLNGPLVGELKAIGPGYVVQVAGKISGRGDRAPQFLDAYQYRIVEVITPQGRRKPVVGRLIVDKTSLTLVDENFVFYRLGGNLKGLEDADGKKFCLVGKITGWGSSRNMQVEFYNILDR